MRAMHLKNNLALAPLARRASAALLLALLAGCAAYTHHRTGLRALDDGRLADGVLELQRASELAPDDVVYRQSWLGQRERVTQQLLARAQVAAARGAKAEAEQQYRAILQIDRSNARALAGLELLAQTERNAAELAQAREALARKEAGRAASLLERVLERSPQLPEALSLRQDIDALQVQDRVAAPSLSALYQKPVNLEFRDASLKMVFDALSRSTGINFIFDRDVKPEQRTTVVVRQTGLEDAIDVLLSTNQLEKKVLNASSVLIYPATPAKLKEYQDLMVRAFYLANIEAKTAARMLQTVLKLKDVYVDEKYHLLILRESPETIALAEKLIALQDLEEPEVMLEVEVLEVNRSRLLNLGVQLPNQLTLTPLPLTVLPGQTAGSGQTMRLNELRGLTEDRVSINVPSATINLQKTDGDANLLANPRLRVRDREKARILIGGKVPVVTTTTTPNGFLSESIQYLDVGLKLDVEPEIHLRDEIALKLGLEVSSLVGTIKTASGSQAYQIGTRNISSSLRLKDGETQVLAGLINDADRSDASRVPFLGDVPLLGRLFSSQKDDRQKTEIIMSITPHLVRNIQRRGPAAEAFWSGTEATLRTRPVQLRSLAPVAEPNAASTTAAPPVAGAAPVAAPDVRPAPTPAAAPDASGLSLSWQGPGKAKPGQPVRLTLQLSSEHALRATPLQLAYVPGQLEVLSVREGDYFEREGKGSFSHVVDAASGRVSVGLGSGNGAGVKGQGRLLQIEVRLQPGAPEAELSLIALTPVGSSQAIGRPGLPLAHKLVAEP